MHAVFASTVPSRIAFANPYETSGSRVDGSGQDEVAMRIIVAPDSFKGSVSALGVAEAMERGIHAVFPEAEVLKVPIADGGEGTVEALVAATGGRLLHAEVRGPLGEPVRAHWGVSGDGTTAFIEMAAASGLPLVPKEQRDPRITSTFGTGELMKAALDAGLRKLVIGIGGSATNDGGTGMARALGVRFLDAEGRRSARRRCRPGAPGPHRPVGPGSAPGRAIHPGRLRRGQPALRSPRGLGRLWSPEGRHARHGGRTRCGPGGLRGRRRSRHGPGRGPAAGCRRGRAAWARACSSSRRRACGPAWPSCWRPRASRPWSRARTWSSPAKAARISRRPWARPPWAWRRWPSATACPVICLSGGLGDGADDVLAHGIDALASSVPQPMTLEACMGQGAALVEAAAARVCRLLKVGLFLRR